MLCRLFCATVLISSAIASALAMEEADLIGNWDTDVERTSELMKASTPADELDDLKEELKGTGLVFTKDGVMRTIDGTHDHEEMTYKVLEKKDGTLVLESKDGDGVATRFTAVLKDDRLTVTVLGDEETCSQAIVLKRKSDQNDQNDKK